MRGAASVHGVYGTVRTVVWEDGGGNPASYLSIRPEQCGLLPSDVDSSSIGAAGNRGLVLAAEATLEYPEIGQIDVSVAVKVPVRAAGQPRDRRT